MSPLADPTPLPTPDEVAAMRERHAPDPRAHDVDTCVLDGQHWPCDAARMLALVEAQEARLAAVLAECDRLDEDPGEVGPYTLVADLIRRAATGEAT